MGDLNDIYRTDLVHDVLASGNTGYNKLLQTALYANYRNVETISATKELTDDDYQIQLITPSGSDQIIELPPESTTNHLFWISCASGSSFDVIIKDDSGATTFETLDAGETVLCLSNGSFWDTQKFGAAGGGGDVSVPNKIVNGAMQVAQQGASATGITASGYPAGGADLVYLWMNDAGTIDYTQELDTFKDYGFANSLKIAWTTAKASPAAGSYMAAEWRFAGQDLQDFKKGLTGSEQAAIGFYIEANKTGTYIVELIDDDNSRHVCEAYTIAASATPQFVEIALPADTTGELDNDNAKSMTLRLWLMAGSTYTSGTLAAAWASETDANRAVGQVNLADTIANYVEITGIGLYVGSLVPNFERKSFDTELMFVRRYYRTTYAYGTSLGTITNTGNIRGVALDTNFFYFGVQFWEMASVPATTLYSPATGASDRIRDNTTLADVSGVIITDKTRYTGFVFAGGNFVASRDYGFHRVDDARL